MNKKVFVSFVWKDHERAQKALRKLQKEGVLGSETISSVENLTESTLGTDIRTQIKERIGGSNIVVLIWSKDAAHSPWVQYELGMAKALDVPIVVVWADKTAPQLPTEIEGSQVVQLDTKSA